MKVGFGYTSMSGYDIYSKHQFVKFEKNRVRAIKKLLKVERPALIKIINFSDGEIGSYEVSEGDTFGDIESIVHMIENEHDHDLMYYTYQEFEGY